jgi:hypothetical protein
MNSILQTTTTTTTTTTIIIIISWRRVYPSDKVNKLADSFHSTRTE